MKNVSRKIIAMIAALSVAVTGFVFDSNKSEAKDKSGDMYYEIQKAPGQTKSLTQLDNNRTTYFTGTKVIFTGADVDGQELPFNCAEADIQKNSQGVITNYDATEGSTLVTYEFINGSSGLQYSLSNGQLAITANEAYSIISISGKVYRAVNKNRHKYLDNFDSLSEWIYIDSSDGYSYLNSFDYTSVKFVDMQVFNSDGEIWDGVQLLQPTSYKTTYTVETRDGEFSVSANNDNVVVKKTENGFTLETKKIGVTDITITDNFGHTSSLSYMVVRPTPGNATKTEETPSVNNSSESSSSTPAAAPAKPKQITTVDANGKTVKKFSTYDGYYTTLDSYAETIPDGATFTSSEIEKTSDYYISINEKFQNFIEDAFGEQHSYFSIGKMLELDLADTTGALIHQLDDYVTVSMNMPSDVVIGENQKLIVYRVGDDGVYACPTVVKDGKIQFATNHFSTYVLVVADKDTPVVGSDSTAAQATKSPKTGEN